jgi:hypothetical protein
MTRLTQEEQDLFLARPQIAHFTTVRRAGRPHVAPVWFLWDRGKAWVMADGGAVKVKNIQNNTAVALSIATPERPLSYVVLEGQAKLSSEALVPMVERMCVLYDGPERGAEFAKELINQERMVLLEVAIDKIITWKDGD